MDQIVDKVTFCRQLIEFGEVSSEAQYFRSRKRGLVDVIATNPQSFHTVCQKEVVDSSG